MTDRYASLNHVPSLIFLSFLSRMQRDDLEVFPISSLNADLTSNSIVKTQNLGMTTRFVINQRQQQSRRNRTNWLCWEVKI